MGQRIKQIGLLRYKFYTCTEPIEAVAKEILMRISNEDDLHASEARGQLPEGSAGQRGPSREVPELHCKSHCGGVTPIEFSGYCTGQTAEDGLGGVWFTLCAAGSEQQCRAALGVQLSCCPAVPPSLWNWPRASAPPAPAPPRARTQTALGEKCICIVCWQSPVKLSD